eukprot:Partr_v1_DN28567_c0_g2_i1_m72816 putative Glucosidase, alpha
MRNFLSLIAVQLLLIQQLQIPLVVAVKESDFKKCEQSGFCARNRAFADRSVETSRESTYSVLRDSLTWNVASGEVSGLVENSEALGVRFDFTLIFYEAGIVRLRVDEVDKSIKRRYEVRDVLIDDLKYLTRSSITYEQSSDGLSFVISFDNHYSAVFQLSPIAIDVSAKDGQVPLISLNRKGWFNFEHYRPAPPPPVAPAPAPATEEGSETEVKPVEPVVENKLTVGSWKETFNGHEDSKKYGPSSIALDVKFPGFKHVYGLAEHASTLSLKSTRGGDQCYTEPYRLYNLDVFEFELNKGTALYGAVPYVLSHKYDKLHEKSFSVGFFWLNAAETWVDVTHSPPFSRFVNQEASTSSQTDPEVFTNTHWISESGLMDMFIILGDKPHDIARGYAMLTGAQHLPQYFSLGYHQCRWNYMDTKEVSAVNNGFEEHLIPADVIWLDIEHTNDKQYFTWHPTNFKEPLQMIDEVARKGRKMVTIVDPHIKRSEDYHVKKEASTKGFFVRKKDGGEYDGWCWPGSSSWIDFTNPDARQFWAKLFAYGAYPGSSENLFTWNDMNEPSVFTGPEITMNKDCLHWQDWEHRDVHNIYGMYLHRATYGGHFLRSLPSNEHRKWTNRQSLAQGPGPHRPFILSRAFFAGTQRYGAIWTGDNMGKWDHLESSAPMLLTVGVSGIGFCGVDVGGFFHDPSPELLTRWYQAGIHYPFFRAHAHLDTKRREPWLLGEPYLSIIRSAIVTRYQMIPYWYTLFRQGQLRGVTPMRPLFYEFPEDEGLFAVENQYMIGSALMVKPVVVPAGEGGTTLSMLLPGSEPWFDYYSHIAYPAGGNLRFDDIKLETPAPLLVRAGSVVPLRMRVRRSTYSSRRDPLTLLITLDSNGKAEGELYLDDGESFSYAMRGEFSHQLIKAEVNKTSIKITSKNLLYGEFDSDIEKKVRKMKPWQKPFISDPLYGDDGNLITDWSDTFQDMTLMSSSKYRSTMNNLVKIERIVILGIEYSDFSKWDVSSVGAVTAVTISGEERNKTKFDSSDLSFSTIDRVSSGQLTVSKLVIRKPGVGAALDFEILINANK